MPIDEGVYTRDLTTGYEFRQLTNSDATEYDPEDGLKALMVLSAGDLSVTDHYGNTTVISGLVAGQYLYIRPLRVNATSSTATVLGIFR